METNHADHGNTGIHGLLQRGWSWPRHPLRLAALAGTGIMWACTKWVVVSQPFGSEEQKVHHRAHAGFTHHPRRGHREHSGTPNEQQPEQAKELARNAGFDVHAEAYAGKAANLYVAGGQGLGSSRRVVTFTRGVADRLRLGVKHLMRPKRAEASPQCRQEQPV